MRVQCLPSTVRFHRKVPHNVQLNLAGKVPPWRSNRRLKEVKLFQSQDPEVLPRNPSNNPHTTPEPILMLLLLSFYVVWKQKNPPTATLGNVCVCVCISFQGLWHSLILHTILLEAQGLHRPCSESLRAVMILETYRKPVVLGEDSFPSQGRTSPCIPLPLLLCLENFVQNKEFLTLFLKEIWKLRSFRH